MRQGDSDSGTWGGMKEPWTMGRILTKSGLLDYSTHYVVHGVIYVSRSYWALHRARCAERMLEDRATLSSKHSDPQRFAVKWVMKHSHFQLFRRMGTLLPVALAMNQVPPNPGPNVLVLYDSE